MGGAGMYGGTQKCGRVNVLRVLGQARVIRAYAETYGCHM